jgi:hypothetical protein
MLMLFTFVLFMGLLYHTTRQLQALNGETYRPKYLLCMMLDRGGPRQGKSIKKLPTHVERKPREKDKWDSLYYPHQEACLNGTRSL